MKRKAKFTNAAPPARRTQPGKNTSIFSDGGAENPKLGNRPGPAFQRKQPSAPTSGMSTLDATDGNDYFRRPQQPKGKFTQDPDPSITPARVTLSVRMRFNAIRNLTPERLTGYLEQWQLGFFRMAGMTWDLMQKRDYQLKIDAPKRMKAVARHGYDILTRNVPDSDKPLAEEQQEFLKYFYDNLQTTTAINPDEEGGASLLFRQMMDATAKYYAVHEIVWQPQADGNLTAKLINIPVWWLEGTRGKLRFLQSEFQVYGTDMEPGEWLITCGDGLMEACSIIYLFKNLPIRSWLQLLDRLGAGGLVGKTTAAYGSNEWNQMVEALQDFSEEWAGVFSQGSEVSFLESKNVVGEGPFYAIIDKMDRAITQMWRGGDLSTSAKAEGVGANLQADESEILETDDAKMLEETLERKLSAFALAWKFGEAAPQYAYLKLRTTPTQNINDDLAVDKFLLGVGMLGKKSTLERYSRPDPEANDDEVLQGQVAPDPQTPAEGGKAAFQNEAASQPSEEFMNAAGKQLAAAVHDDLDHAAQQVIAALQISDDTLREKKLKELLEKWPGITADTLLAPKSAEVLANTVATA